VVASLIFSGMSGSAVADAAGIGKIIIEMMTRAAATRRGYAAAITAASATIGPIIPPSIPMVLYALVSDTSIGYLFLGGIVPGLLMGAVLMAMNAWLAHRRGFAVEEPVPLRELPGSRSGLSRAADAGDPALRHLWRRHHADRGRRVAALYALILAGGSSTAR
jgi:TRAP-type transport system large permease protein